MCGYVAREELRGGVDGGSAIGAEFGVPAIVEDDVGGPSLVLIALDLLHELGCDVIGGGVNPVAGHGVPGDGRHVEFACGVEHVRAATTVGRTKETDGFAGDLRKGVAGAGELVADLEARGAGEVRVAPGVIADEMAGVGDAAGEGWFGLGETAHHEEGRAHVALSEDVEEAGRPGGVGSVVEGKGEFAGAMRRDEGATEELRGGPERSIGEATYGKPCGSGRAEPGINARR